MAPYKTVFSLSHHALSGPSCVFFMVSNRELESFPQAQIRGETVEKWTIQANIVQRSSERKKKQYVSTTHIPMHFELNHTSPCAAVTAADRLSAEVIFPFNHTSNSVCDTHTRYCCLPLSTLSLGGHSTNHCDNPRMWEPLQKQSPPFLPLPFPAH